ncbi:DUF4091 domain-containing protein [Algoriphagus confluentis]|uniref:Glycoside hydrolase 123 catalytic domain-containing protein n=1 Tax=Algoriphagus confluentis TaxID=1697556 RepID=A0ABQ6PNJ1_9BACT|nr:hypothetical protein Aconfl_21680 [Algoriphagus confluentis]
MKWLIFSFLMISSSVWGQKAEFIKLEKLYEPAPSSGTYSAWRQESLLIPFRYESTNTAPVSIQVASPGLEFFQEWFEIHSVWADFSAGNCGQAKANGSFREALIPDRVRPLNLPKLEADSTVKWGLLKLQIPRWAKPGLYDLSLSFSQNGKNSQLKGKLTVLEQVAPLVEEVSFGADFWQFPISVADYHGIKPWSAEHWKKVGEMLHTLRAINQESLTVSIFWDLYNTKLRPLDEMMIQVTRNEDNTYSYDFSNLEAYIQMAQDLGVDKQISIHNLFPWNQNFYFFDARSRQVKAVNAAPNSGPYQDFFKPLIQATSDFLEKKKWKQKTYWVIDERDPTQTILLKNWINEIAPGFKFSFAGRLSPALAKQMEEYALPVNVSLTEEQFTSRVKINGRTMMYTSCFEQANQPNSLLTSDLRDIYFLAHLADIRGYQGILHWAYNLWSRQIKTSAVYSDVPSGDAHFVYPDGELSVRYLVFQDAIEEIGKFRLISKVKNPGTIRQSWGRYFLINVEKERFLALEAMKAYLND